MAIGDFSRTIASAVLAGGLVAATVPAAQANEYGSMWDDWYVEFDIGGPVTDEYDFTRGGAPGTYDPDAGFGLAAAIGTYMRDNVRADLFFGWFTAGDGEANFGGVVPHTGDVDVFAIVGSIYYEFQNTGIAGGAFTPWVGAGVGVQIFDYDNLGGGDNLNGSDAALTGVLHAGFDYALTDRVDLVGRYSLAFVGSHDTQSDSGVPITGESHVDHILMGGVRFKFGAR